MWRGLLIIFMWLGLVACDKPQLPPIASDGVILAFGDSLTAGYGTSKAHAYPAVLQVLSGREVINAGVSGETTTQGLPRLQKLLSEMTPDLLILMQGGNDILRNHDFAIIKRNLAAMIELAQSQGITVVLIGVPRKSIFSDSAPFYQELADEYGLVFDDDLLIDLLRDARLKSDAIHLNQQGYKLMAENIYSLLQTHGALD